MRWRRPSNISATVSPTGRPCRRTSTRNARVPKRAGQSSKTLITDFRLAVREALHQVNLHSDQMTLAADSLKTIATESSHRAQAAAASTSEASSNVAVEEQAAATNEIAQRHRGGAWHAIRRPSHGRFKTGGRGN